MEMVCGIWKWAYGKQKAIQHIKGMYSGRVSIEIDTLINHLRFLEQN